MDFKTVCRIILGEFQRQQIKYALMGGFALGLLGVPRATVDLDFLIHADNLPQIKKIMADQGYVCFYQTENVSQYISPVKIFGEIDFLHAFRRLSLEMLNRALEKKIFEGEMKIKVLRPEDLIGLKVQGAVNNEARKNREYGDIESLMSYYRADLNWRELERYFSLFSQDSLYNELKKKYLGA